MCQSVKEFFYRSQIYCALGKSFPFFTYLSRFLQPGSVVFRSQLSRFALRFFLPGTFAPRIKFLRLQLSRFHTGKAFLVLSAVAQAIQSVSSSSLVFLFLTLVILMIAGMFMEALSVVIIVAPILHPVALVYGVDPIFFGFFVVFVMCIGIATPPFGPCLFVSCSWIRKIMMIRA